MLLARKLMPSFSFTGGWSVVHNGTDPSLAQAGDFVIAIQAASGSFSNLPALASGFTSLATDGASDTAGPDDEDQIEVNIRVSCRIVAGPPTIASLRRCIILRPTVAGSFTAVSTTLNATSFEDPVALVSWGIRASRVNTNGTYPTVSDLTRSAEYLFEGGASSGNANVYWSLMLAAYVGDGNLRPGSYTLTNGSNYDFRGFIALHGA